MACKVNRTRQWAARLLFESYSWPHSSFVTLTYDDDHLPSGGTLVKRDVQLYFKRLRKALSDRKIRYYLCGEYGDETSRPHYHYIGYNLDSVDDYSVIDSVWNKGSVVVGSVTYESCRYVASYVQKKVYGLDSQNEYGDRLPPFQLQSNGLGLQYLLDYYDHYNGNFTINGRVISFPKYYKDKLISEGLVTKDELHIKDLKYAKEIEDKIKEHLDIPDKFERHREAKILDLDILDQEASNLAAKYNKDVSLNKQKKV
jgi:hypothetical protein